MFKTFIQEAINIIREIKWKEMPCLDPCYQSVVHWPAASALSWRSYENQNPGLHPGWLNENCILTRFPCEFYAYLKAWEFLGLEIALYKDLSSLYTNIWICAISIKILIRVQFEHVCMCIWKLINWF